MKFNNFCFISFQAFQKKKKKKKTLLLIIALHLVVSFHIQKCVVKSYPINYFVTRKGIKASYSITNYD